MYSCCIRRIIHNILLGLGGLPRLLSFVVLKKLSSFLFVSLCVRQSPYEACTHISSLMTVSIVLDYGSERLTLIASSETSPLLPGVSAPDFPSAPEASTHQPRLLCTSLVKKGDIPGRCSVPVCCLGAPASVPALPTIGSSFSFAGELVIVYSIDCW